LYYSAGWKLTEELRIKVVDDEILCDLTYKREVKVGDNKNVLAVDVNENNRYCYTF